MDHATAADFLLSETTQNKFLSGVSTRKNLCGLKQAVYFYVMEAVNFVTDTTFLKASVLECLWLNLQTIFYSILPYQSFLHIFNLFQMVMVLHLVPTLSHF